MPRPGTWIAALLLLTLPLSAQELFFPRTPAISPDGQTILFACGGDIWSVPFAGGRATRLTAHPAYDHDPVFAPDGARFAFASDRYDQDDVFTMAISGGSATRVTFAESGDTPVAWDAGHILFRTRRLFDYPMANQVWTIPATGGTPFPLLGTFLDEVAPGPAGLLASIGRRRLGRKGYRGSYQPDLWLFPTDGEPRQLTDHRGIDSHPMWGPGHASVLWRSDLDGTFNLWQMQLADGTLRQLTFFTADGPRSARASADGSRVVFSAGVRLYTLEVESGEVRALDLVGAADRTVNLEVSETVRGGASEVDVAGDEVVVVARGEIVLFHRELGAQARLLLPHAARDEAASFRPGTPRELLFCSDRASVWSDGWVFDAAPGVDDPAVREVHESLVALQVARLREELRALDPSARVQRRGDQLVVWARDGWSDDRLRERVLAETTGVGLDSPVQTRLETFEPAFGPRRIGLARPADTGQTTLRDADELELRWLTPDSIDCHSPRWSPDGELIAYVRNKGDLHVMRADGSEDRQLLAHWSSHELRWSPDSRYLAYATEDRNYNSDVWIIAVDGTGAPLNVSQHPDNDDRPVWSPDGRTLAWSTNRHDNQADVYIAYLRREDYERSRDDWKLWEETREDPDEEVRVEIDVDDLFRRTRRLSSLPGNEWPVAIHPHGDRIWFSASVDGDRDLFSVDRFGGDRERVTSGGANPQAVRALDGKSAVCLRSGTPAELKLESGKLTSWSFSVRVALDRAAERLQVQREGWQRLGAWFYDPAMHGCDWPAVGEKYAGWVREVEHERDFSDLLNMMLGELNSSHMGYSAPRGEDSYPASGYLGLRFDPAYTGGGLRVLDVLVDGPCDGRLQAGDLLLEVGGWPVGAHDNLHRGLEGRQGERTRLLALRDGDELRFTVEPISGRAVRDLSYRAMEERRRAAVAEAGEGRLAYVHIQGMGQSQLEEFERDLYAAADGKEALLIDVRDNGGGWTTDMLLTILTQPVHAYTIGRDGAPGYPQGRFPLFRWERPVVVLCNERSFSNAEIFSHAIQTTGRGVVVGNETAGGVISTGGWSTLNGGRFRMPFRGWYVYASGTNMEHGGCRPDVIVPYGPREQLRGVDPQLDVAVKLALEAADALERDPETGMPRR